MFKKIIHMKNYPAIISILLLFIEMTSAQTINKDKPIHGTWDFKLKKVWTVEKPGNEDFGRPAELRGSNDGTLVIHDFVNKKSYIFNERGEFITAFANQDQNPGYVERYLNCFISDNHIIITSPSDLYFYTMDGKYVKTLPNNPFINFPYVFLSDNEFLGGPGSLANLIGKPVVIKSTNCSTGDAETFYELLANKKISEEKSGGQAAMVILGVTPQMSIAYDKKNKLLYCGRTDDYKICISDLNGKSIGNFSLDRERKKISAEEKKNIFSGSSIPEEQLKSIIASIPDELAYFFKILVNNGLIYVFAVDEFNNKQNKLHIDIFSPDGKYLYKGFIDFGNNIFFRNPENIFIQGDHLYVILNSMDTDKKVFEKYRISIPRQ